MTNDREGPETGSSPRMRGAGQGERQVVTATVRPRAAATFMTWTQ